MIHLKKISHRGLRIHYTTILASYWFLSAILSVFLIPLLREQGFETDKISILIAIRAVSSCIAQPIVASFAQRYSKKIPLKGVVAGLCGMGVIITAIHLTVNINFTGAILIFIGYGATLNCTSPMIDAMSNQYILAGKNINYTVSRTIGSITWAFAALGFGNLIDFDGHGENILVIQICALIVLAILAVTIENPLPTENLKTSVNQETGPGHSNWYIMTRYKIFSLILVSSSIIMMTYSINMSYLITKIESVGGTTKNLGIAQFILAIVEVFVPLYFFRIKDKFGIEKLVILAFTGCAARTIITSLAPSIPLIYLGQMTEAIVALTYSGNVTFIREKIMRNDQIQAQGLLAAVQSGAGCIGSVIAAPMIAKLGINGLFTAISVVAVLGVAFLYIGYGVITASETRSNHKIIN